MESKVGQVSGIGGAMDYLSPFSWKETDSRHTHLALTLPLSALLRK